MDPFLADYFGTNQEVPEQVTETDDLEKMAQLVMLDKIAQNQNIDLSELTDEQYVQLAQEVFESNGQEKVAAQQEQLTELEKEAAAKFEESVYLGKVAAHALWNELNAIQQVAMEKEAKKNVFQRIGQYVGEGKKATQEAKGMAKEYGNIAKSVGFEDRASREAAERLADKASKAQERTGKKVVGGAAGVGALGVAGGTAAALRARKKKNEGQSKEGSAFNQLSDARAYEILQQYGLADDQGNVVTPDQLQKHAEQQEKTSADRLADAVEAEAWEKLAALGYPVIDQS